MTHEAPVLPDDVVLEILTKLDCMKDVIRFLTTCTAYYVPFRRLVRDCHAIRALYGGKFGTVFAKKGYVHLMDKYLPKLREIGQRYDWLADILLNDFVRWVQGFQPCRTVSFITVPQFVAPFAAKCLQLVDDTKLDACRVDRWTDEEFAVWERQMSHYGPLLEGGKYQLRFMSSGEAGRGDDVLWLFIVSGLPARYSFPNHPQMRHRQYLEAIHPPTGVTVEYQWTNGRTVISGSTQEWLRFLLWLSAPSDA
jgi:hypothetical protein